MYPGNCVFLLLEEFFVIQFKKNSCHLYHINQLHRSESTQGDSDHYNILFWLTLKLGSYHDNVMCICPSICMCSLKVVGKDEMQRHSMTAAHAYYSNCELSLHSSSITCSADVVPIRPHSPRLSI